MAERPRVDVNSIHSHYSGGSKGWQNGAISPDEPSPPRRPRPGTITPLGIRHDMSKGPLGLQSASNTIRDMDNALSRLHSWQSRHEQQMATLRRKEMDEFEELYLWRERRKSADGAGPSGAGVGGGDGIETGDRKDYRRSRETRGLHRPGTAAAAVTTTSALNHLVADELPARPQTAAPSRPSTATAKSRALIPQEMDLLRQSMDMTFDRRRPRVSTAPSSSGQRTLEGEQTVSRGDQLLAELEAELADLDKEVEESEVVAWESDLHDILTKMDALQTGYQSGALLPIGSGTTPRPDTHTENP